MHEVWYNRSMKIVGHLTPKVIKTFDLDYMPGEEITLSAQRKKHMENIARNLVILMLPMNGFQRLLLIRTILGTILMVSLWSTSNVLMVMFW